LRPFPFVDLSEKKDQEYFSDGLSEELLNTLIRINGLRVAARTSSFAFKGTAVDLATVAHKLNVSSILEGSVRKAGDRVRITADLVDASNGFNLWSQTYDRELKDILVLQTEIASAVAAALKVTLFGHTREHLTDGGTSNPRAFDAYLRAKRLAKGDEKSELAALAGYQEALSADPNYAIARGSHARTLALWANDWVFDPERRKRLLADARTEAEAAVSLAPDSGQLYGMLSDTLAASSLDYAMIEGVLKHAVQLEPGNADILSSYADISVRLGRTDIALTAAKKALVLDPLDPVTVRGHGVVLFYAHRFIEAREPFARALQMDDGARGRFWVGWNELALANNTVAVEHCEKDPDSWYQQTCLAIGYYRLGRKPEASAMLERMKKEQGNLSAYQYAEIYAQWNQPDEALHWLEVALKEGDPGIIEMSVDPFLGSVRDRPRFKQIMSELKLPT
jgi:TolB-like protein/tetratricopeptide (TPR) repeat protein